MAQEQNNYGVLLVNLGSTQAATPSAVRKFLNQFLSDPRVVDRPRWFWLPLLRAVILPFRSPKVAKLYKEIWTENGSPLLAISNQQLQAFSKALDQNGTNIEVELAMTYGQPSIQSAIHKLKQKKINKLVVLPLYPQYSSTTTASVFDAVADAFKAYRHIPDTRWVMDYHDHPKYIEALANSVVTSRSPHSQLLIFSFHGLPQRYVETGDPYQQQCIKTATQVANKLGLNQNQWKIAYQSRIGREPWLTPYLDEVLEELPAQGITKVDIVSPAFAADCLETLEELAQSSKSLFLEAGGTSFHYIPALNDNEDSISLMQSLVEQQIKGW